MFLAWLSRNIRHLWDGGFRCRTMYLATVGSVISMTASATRHEYAARPSGVVAVDHSNRISNFLRDARPAGLATADAPGPERAKTFAMPRQHCFRLDDHQHLLPARPNSLQR